MVELVSHGFADLKGENRSAGALFPCLQRHLYISGAGCRAKINVADFCILYQTQARSLSCLGCHTILLGFDACDSVCWLYQPSTNCQATLDADLDNMIDLMFNSMLLTLILLLMYKLWIEVLSTQSQWLGPLCHWHFYL